MNTEFKRDELEKAYEPQEVEDSIYKRWEASGFFNPDRLPPSRYPLSAKRFSIIMPPPNANGALHIGHALFVTLQDIMIRFRRMQGMKTLWLPGADHAGFETQVVYDKKLEKEGKRRSDFSREELYQNIWNFTEENKGVMVNQLKKLGASCDWSRMKFTLDPDIVEKVHDTFIQLYKDGLIYRGNRIVNWCVKHQTTLSDLEVKYEERSDPLYYIKYGPFELATVRPETKFGDTAVAVHPDDKRYQSYIGNEIEIETLLGKSKIKVIADTAVDPAFGTGVIKVTPAHDATDFEIGLRHNLEVRQVIDKYGKLNEKTGPYAGLKVAEARIKVAADMAERGLLTKTDPSYKHNVAVCYKCGNVVEPLVMPQWFVKMTEKGKLKKSLRDMAVEAVKSKKIVFIPDRFTKIFNHWMGNLRDWNISRQIIWGIRIPAWFCLPCGDIKIKPKIRANWFFIRHGETDWNKEGRIQGHSDNPLNDEGRKQAYFAAHRLEGEKIDLIISSDLKRAKETAEIIGKSLGIEVIYDAGLRERKFGTWEGKTPKDIGENIFREFLKTQNGPEDMELWEMLEARVQDSLKKHRADHKHKNIAVIAHGGVMRSLLRSMKGITNFENIKIANTEIIKVSISDPCKKCGSDFVEQDPDVLDTWFSSGQWPFLTLGYPKGKDFKTFYPTSVMETGWDILFFWVARMIIFGLYRTGKAPFKTVYLHGLVRDKDRQKMSKSKGNVIDPLGVSEIYGTDAVRMALIVGSTAGNDPVISEDKIKGYRNFANKVWNAARFTLMNLENTNYKTQNPKFTAEDKKRLKELNNLVKSVTKDIEAYKFHLAAENLYHYFWHTFADKIIESVKPRLNGADERDRDAARALIFTILQTNLKLLHPFMPYVTEATWEKLSGAKGLLMIEKWPKS